ncbi:crumbs protein 3 [Fusarium sporotrichioides]|uniref:Crumbs protein 3 n=1 Tax=Fusarium sporotrichioides TaxID=5514 RepID=A0A395RMX6_FUSSP|nr:crumbs protein 3 [Fusarium sporotrichioides]
MCSLTRSLISFLSLVTYVQCVTLFVYPGNLPDGTNQPDPANNQRYSIGQSIPVKWRTDLTSLSLGVSQILPNGSEIQFMLDCSPDWDADAVFWFQLYNDTDVKGENAIAISQMFNVSTSDSSSERDNESDPDADSNQGLSAGAGAGIAVGAIVGTILLAGLGFFFWRRSRKAKDAVASQQTSESHLQPQPIPQHQGVYEYSHQLPASPASNVVVKPELSSESANVHEAP